MKPKLPPNMSIIIGIICRDGIVMAADGQLTDPYVGTTSEVNKIHVIQFSADHVIVGVAGGYPFTNRVVEKIAELGDAVAIRQKKDVTEIIENAIRQTKAPLDEQQLKAVNDSGAGMIIAFYLNGRPQLSYVDPFSSGIITDSEKHYCAAGIGSFLANYLLDEYLGKDPYHEFGIATAIFAIKKVKDNTRYCGGKTTIMTLRAIPQIEFRSNSPATYTRHVGATIVENRDFIDLAERKLAKMDERTKKSRNRKIGAILDTVAVTVHIKHMNKILKAQRDLQAQQNLNKRPPKNS
jgi:20S proteasome alpha/beta subunit